MHGDSFVVLKSVHMPTEGRMFPSVSLIDRQARVNVSRSFQSFSFSCLIFDSHGYNLGREDISAQCVGVFNSAKWIFKRILLRDLNSLSSFTIQTIIRRRTEGLIDVSRCMKVIDYWVWGFWNHLSKCRPFLTCYHMALMDFKRSRFKIACHWCSLCCQGVGTKSGLVGKDD